MNRYQSILILFLLLFSQQVSAQELSIGDTLPDCRYSGVLRYSSDSLSLSDFRGRLLILALWRTTCGHSISVFSHLDSIQQRFGKKVMVLGISTDEREVIEHYFKTNLVAKQTRLPSITDDTLLSKKRFSFVYIPHMVVVDGTGVIRAITYPEDITEQAVATWLSGGTAKVPLKKEVADFNFEVPVYEEGGGRNTAGILYSSVISRYIQGVSKIEELSSSDTRYFYKAYNKTIPELYAQALDFPLDARRFVLDVKDSSNFIRTREDKAEWDSAHRWVYNLVLPKDYPSPNQFVLEDLNRFFGVQAVIEKREVNCLALTRTGTKERWKTKGEKGHLVADGDVLYLQNISMSMVWRVIDAMSSIPVIDETGLGDEKADVILRDKPGHLKQFSANLQPYDLDLISTVRTMDVLVIKERE